MGDSPVVQVQWLGLLASTAGSLGVIPGWGTEIRQVKCQGQKNECMKTSN